MLLSDFLATFINDYLFGDLKTMAGTTPETSTGHLGYPMLMASAAGIEMLGILVSADHFRDDPLGNFLRYWERYLYTSEPRRAVGAAVYQLARHGIAHNFAAKQPFRIYKPRIGETSPGHLVNEGNETKLDVVQLFVDLRQSYEGSFTLVASGETQAPTGENPATMQDRLNELVDFNTKKLACHLTALQKLPSEPSTGPATSPKPGFTGALGPVPASSKGLK